MPQERPKKWQKKDKKKEYCVDFPVSTAGPRWPVTPYTSVCMSQSQAPPPPPPPFSSPRRLGGPLGFQVIFFNFNLLSFKIFWNRFVLLLLSERNNFEFNKKKTKIHLNYSLTLFKEGQQRCPLICEIKLNELNAVWICSFEISFLWHFKSTGRVLWSEKLKIRRPKFSS